jgi:hypothetical protein
MEANVAKIETPAGEPELTRNLTREELRERFFAKAQPRSVPLKYNGIDLEWRQPTIHQATEAQDGNEGKNYMVLMLVQHTYVPGTNELFFEPDDYDVLIDMPMSGDFTRATQEIAKLLDLGVEDKVKN